MPHVTFVHGVGRQLSAQRTSDAWRAALAEERGIALRPDDVSLVYWADLFGDAVQEPEMAFVTNEIFDELDRAWREQLESLGRQLLDELEAELRRAAERVNGVVVDAFMRVFVRQMHAFLLDTDGLRQRIRERFLALLDERRPDVVVAHSMGSVIAYDCLKRVPDCPLVAEFLTFGSPLGFPAIQRHLQPGWTAEDGFPGDKVMRWSNVFDRYDPVTISDAGLARDYRRRGAPAVHDQTQSNRGANRHEAFDYLRGGSVRSALADALGRTAP